MVKKRIVKILYILIYSLFILLTRLAQIQLFQTESFSNKNINLIEESVKQRSHEIIINDGRGNILDKQGKSLTNENAPVLVLFPFLNKITWPVEKLAEILNVNKKEIVNAINNKNRPIIYGDKNPVILTIKQKNAIEKLAIPGVIVVEKQFKIKDRLAEQLIGITGENSELFEKRYNKQKLKTNKQTQLGITGLQASFDEFLLSEDEEKLVYHVDAIGGPLFGVDVKYVNDNNPFFPLNIKTTIDTNIQLMAEQLVDAHKIKKGGIILLDIKNNNILANVSRPVIDKNNPYASIGTKNVMFQKQISGSVFKTVIAAAAIDYNLIEDDKVFDCSRKINGDPEEKYNYGMLNFTDSFARSCNNAFGQLGKELMNIDQNIIEQYAKKLSLSNKVGWRGSIFNFESFEQLFAEETGRVFLNNDEKRDENFVALSAIGQHEVRVTPLAVANMMSTIAKGGKKEMVRAVTSIQYKNNTEMTSFQKQPLPGESISPYTAMELQRLLREVVVNENGTGHFFRNLPYEVAGKSGTAQTGIFSNGKELYNKWFAGFFPFSNPQYALVVVNLDVMADEGGINELFANIVNELYLLDKKD